MLFRVFRGSSLRKSDFDLKTLSPFACDEALAMRVTDDDLAVRVPTNRAVQSRTAMPARWQVENDR